MKRSYFSNASFGALFLLTLFSLSAFGQPNYLPPPENLKVVEQPKSPLQITIGKLQVFPNDGKMLTYSVKNNGTANVIGFVVNGMPGTTQRAVPLEAPLLPGTTKSFIVLDYPLTGEHLAKIDFVLLQDGGMWGTRASGDADFVVNFFDGLKRVIADSKSLVSEADDEKLTKFINSPPNFPENAGDIRNWTRKQEGFMRGYGVGLFSFRESLKIRGDVKGIPGRIADLERSLGATSAPGAPKRISMGASWLDLPVKILGVSIGKDPVSFDQDISARPDWLNGLAIKIKNTSGKTITRMNFSLDFSETNGSGGRMIYDLAYGPPPGVTNLQAHNKAETPIQPDGVFEFGLDESEYPRLKKYIESRQPLDSLARLHITFQAVYYDDKTGWMGGAIMQDPENPRRWVSVKP